MVGVKTVVVSVVAVCSVFLQPGIRTQPTIDSSSEDNSCSQLEEKLESQAVENMRLRSELESERQMIKTLRNGSCSQAEEIQRLNLELESERCRQRTRGSHSVTATSIGSMDHFLSHDGIAIVEDKVYVLDTNPNKIKVYEDLIGFRFVKEISLSGTDSPYHIVYSNKSKCVYISDYKGKCIWVMTTTDVPRLTKLMNKVTWPYFLSLSNEGHLLTLKSPSQLVIYSLNATVIRILHLPQDVKDPQHVVQTSAGNFIILHRLNNASSGPYVISQLANDGQLINRFIPRNQMEELNDPYPLSLDPENNRLFVADYDNNRVILFDSSDLTWSQILLSEEINGIIRPYRLFYDARKKHLFVGQHYGNVTVYEIN